MAPVVCHAVLQLFKSDREVKGLRLKPNTAVLATVPSGPVVVCAIPSHPMLQLSKSDKEVKGMRLKLKQAAAKLEKAQALGTKLQELGVGLVADAQLWTVD